MSGKRPADRRRSDGDEGAGSVTADPRQAPAEYPGPTAVRIPATIVQAFIDHARAEYPNEMCGVVSGTADPARGGELVEWFPARNEVASPLRFSLHPDDLYRIYRAIDDADRAVWAIVHSHVRSPAVPSPTDIGMAGSWPDALWILVSLADDQADATTGAPSVRAWRIVGGQVHEVTIEVVA